MRCGVSTGRCGVFGPGVLGLPDQPRGEARTRFHEKNPRQGQHTRNYAGKCVSASGPKDTFVGSAQGKSPCEVDSDEGRVGGRIEGRTGVHVEREVVLKCEGNNNEGACDMLRWMWRVNIFVGHNASWLDDTSLESNEKKSCAGVRRMRGFGVVFTPPVAQKGIAIACKRNTSTLGLNFTKKEKLEEHLDSEIKRNIIVHSILMSVTMKEDCHHEDGAILRTKSGWWVRVVPPSARRHAQSLHRARWMVDLVAVELAHWDEVLC